MTPCSSPSSPTIKSTAGNCQQDEVRVNSENPAQPYKAPWLLSGRAHEAAPIQDIAISVIPFTIGRHPESNLCLTNSTVSGRHAELLFVAGDLHVRDLKSTNGTLLNGRPVQGVSCLRSGDTLHFGTMMFTVFSGSTYTPLATTSADIVHEALGQLQFDRLLHEPALTPHFQPIVRLDNWEHVGYEILARSRLIGLETPSSMFRIAAERGDEAALSRLSRHLGVRISRDLNPQMRLYLNVHPAEFQGPDLFESLQRLREEFPQIPLVLEIHESSVTSRPYLRQVREILTKLQIQLAYDDFGAGQARLMELVEVPPDVLKFDMSLIQGIAEASPQRRNMLASLVQIVRALQVTALAEGIETAQDAAVCRDLGFELAQGYLFGRASPAKTWVTKTAQPMAETDKCVVNSR